MLSLQVILMKPIKPTYGTKIDISFTSEFYSQSYSADLQSFLLIGNDQELWGVGASFLEKSYKKIIKQKQPFSEPLNFRSII